MSPGGPDPPGLIFAGCVLVEFGSDGLLVGASPNRDRNATALKTKEKRGLSAPLNAHSRTRTWDPLINSLRRGRLKCGKPLAFLDVPEEPAGLRLPECRVLPVNLSQKLSHPIPLPLVASGLCKRLGYGSIWDSDGPCLLTLEYRANI